MSTINCKICGAKITLEENTRAGGCPYCGSACTFPVLANNLLERLYLAAELARHKRDFKKAVAFYTKLTKLNYSEPEFHWGLLLSRYGITYAKDAATNTWRVIREKTGTQAQGILLEQDYASVQAFASDAQKAIYQSQAALIDAAATAAPTKPQQPQSQSQVPVSTAGEPQVHQPQTPERELLADSIAQRQRQRRAEQLKQREKRIRIALGVAVVIVVLLLGAFAFLKNNKTPQSTEKTEPTPEQIEAEQATRTVQEPVAVQATQKQTGPTATAISAEKTMAPLQQVPFQEEKKAPPVQSVETILDFLPAVPAEDETGRNDLNP